MTAIASASDIESVTESFIQNEKQYKTRLIQNLPEEEFWKLVADRLNRPVRPIFLSRAVAFENRDYWTEEYLIEQIFLQLAGTEQTIVNPNNGKNIVISKYYRQASDLKDWIPRTRQEGKKYSVPKFIINKSDLELRLIAELRSAENPEYILKQAVGRIFENLDFKQYHLSIARNLKVRLED